MHDDASALQMIYDHLDPTSDSAKLAKNIRRNIAQHLPRGFKDGVKKLIK
jgi:hypothetical protein